jgi:5-methylcytosine-specific restriction endonuclease McrA
MATFFVLNGKNFPWHWRMPAALWREMRQYIYARDGGRCQYCGEPVELFECHIHHVLELSESGTNHPTNLKTACIGCHKKRHPFMRTKLESLWQG